MRFLLWLRALRNWNFYNWNGPLERKSYGLVLEDLFEQAEFNIGQSYQITSVNRTTGRIGMRQL